MKLIIDIPDEVYKSGQFCSYFDAWSKKLEDLIANGTPYTGLTEAIEFKEEIIRMVNMGVYSEAIVEWVRESEAENE